MTFNEKLALIRQSKLVHPKWYARTYPDVATLGMDPAEHYLRYGAALGRRPGSSFNGAFYRATYPDAAASGMNPLVHYLRKGEKAGRWTSPAEPAEARREARRRIEPIRRKLLSLGFVERALAELEALAATGETPFLRAHAARELALWRLRDRTGAAAESAGAFLAGAADCLEEPEYFARLAALELLCAYARGASEAEADAVLARAEAAGWRLDDILLARAGIAPDPAARLGFVTRALACHGLAPVALAPETDGALYDRLACPAPGPAIADGPLVSVLVAAFDAAAVLPTALGGLQAQRWRNLEILVIDDASRDDTAAVAARFAASDPRIRLIRMETNRGAYVARNCGLAEARGVFVTLHDADDWSHPDKIAAQAEFLIGHPEVVGCTSEQARATGDLVFGRMTGTLKLVNMNTSSFMFRRAYVRAAYGFWDTARFGADTELINRIAHGEGAAAVRRLPTGPLSFQRVSASSIVADAHFGIAGAPFGARLVYFDLYARRHREGGLRSGADPAARAFPAPRIMRADRPAAGPRAYDVAFAADLGTAEDRLAALAAEVALAARRGLAVAVFPVFDYDRPPGDLLLAAPVFELLQAGDADVVAYGETIDCALLVLRDLACFQDDQRYLPEARAAAARFVIEAAELGADPEAAARALGRAADFVRRRFGRAPEWSPADAAARAALAALPDPGPASGAVADADWDAGRVLAALPGRLP